MKKQYSFSLDLAEHEAEELAKYIRSLSPPQVLFGLRFAYNRKEAEEGGYLMPGRKSLVKAETSGLDPKQAKWRLLRWKAMIKTYRDKGYSYPTISRIKKQVRIISEENKD